MYDMMGDDGVVICSPCMDGRMMCSGRMICSPVWIIIGVIVQMPSAVNTLNCLIL